MDGYAFHRRAASFRSGSDRQRWACAAVGNLVSSPSHSVHKRALDGYPEESGSFPPCVVLWMLTIERMVLWGTPVRLGQLKKRGEGICHGV